MKQRQPFKAIPSECKMPDLSDLKPLLGTLLLQEMFIGIGGLSRKAQFYRKNFIRLVGKALREYQEARRAILNQIAEINRPPEEMAKEGRILYILAFTDHIETCINTIARLYKLLKRMEKELPEFPAQLPEQIKTQIESVISIRNTIEHMDERIQEDKIAPGKPIMSALSKDHDGVAVSSHEIKFEELAKVLRKMYEIAQYILTVKKQKS